MRWWKWCSCDCKTRKKDEGLHAAFEKRLTDYLDIAKLKNYYIISYLWHWPYAHVSSTRNVSFGASAAPPSDTRFYIHFSMIKWRIWQQLLSLIWNQLVFLSHFKHLKAIPSPSLSFTWTQRKRWGGRLNFSSCQYHPNGKAEAPIALWPVSEEISSDFFLLLSLWFHWK